MILIIKTSRKHESIYSLKSFPNYERYYIDSGFRDSTAEACLRRTLPPDKWRIYKNYPELKNKLSLWGRFKQFLKEVEHFDPIEETFWS